MNTDDILDALRGLDDEVGDLHGRLRALLHRLEEDRGNPDEAELIRDHREASR